MTATYSLVIPCYNESANLPLLLERCKDLGPHEIILVDNGSTDDTPKVLEKLLPVYPHCRSVRVEVNQGYGFGILSGLKAATGDVLGWTHADMQTDPHDFLTAIDLFNKHNNDPNNATKQNNIFIKGRRYGRPLSDIFFTVGMSFFEMLLLQRVFWDINAQPVLFSRSFFESWYTNGSEPPHDFALDLYAYYQAKTAKLKICRFPVNFSERIHGVSHWNINWTAKLKFIKRTMAFSFNLKKKIQS